MLSNNQVCLEMVFNKKTTYVFEIIYLCGYLCVLLRIDCVVIFVFNIWYKPMCSVEGIDLKQVLHQTVAESRGLLMDNSTLPLYSSPLKFIAQYCISKCHAAQLCSVYYIISFLTMEYWNQTLQYFLGVRGILLSTTLGSIQTNCQWE